MATNQQQNTKATEVKTDVGDSILKLVFADSKIPTMEKHSWYDFVQFGEQNNYPEYIAMLFNKSAKHQAIINGKVTYIVGNGLKPKNDNPQAEQFLQRANENQTWDELIEWAVQCGKINGGFYFQVIPKYGGGFNVYPMPFKNIRISKCGTKFHYKNNWEKHWNEPEQIFPKFNPKIKEASIFYFKEDNPDATVYPLPDYVATCNWIESDVEISKATLTNAKTGFSASTMISFFDGSLTPEKKKDITRRLDNAATGAEGKKTLVTFNNDPNKKPVVDKLGESDLTKEDFTAISNLITQNILTGHGITHGLLFAIQEEGKLGGATELKTAFDIFKNTYVNKNQIRYASVVNYFSSIHGINEEYKFQDVEAVGLQIDPVQFKEMLPKEWVLEKLGINAADYGIAPTAPTTGITPQAQSAETNSVLTNLTAKQHQQVMRIVRQYSKGQLNDKQSILMLTTGYNMTEQQAKTMLGIEDETQQFSKQYDETDVALMFSECGQARENFTIVKSKTFSEDDDEFSFAFAAVAELTELEKQVTDLLKKDSKLTNEQIAQALKLPIEKINIVTEKLLTDGILAAPAANGIRRLLEPTGTRKLPELLTMYSYEKRPDAAGAELLPTSRPFCVKMIGLDRLYTRKEIQTISQKLGYSVFNRAGGFWNNNGTIEPHCRHEWRSQIVIKKK